MAQKAMENPIPTSVSARPGGKSLLIENDAREIEDVDPMLDLL